MKKKWTWSTTGYGFVGKSHDDIIKLCNTAGLSSIEGAPPLFEGIDDKDLQAIGTKYREAGIKIETFHLPFSAAGDIASFYETVRSDASWKQMVDDTEAMAVRALAL